MGGRARVGGRAATVVGGGLAGCEAAWQIAQRGIHVDLYEMRPRRMTPAHVTDGLAELVCSNSLGSDLPDRASGLLKAELRLLGSLLLVCAQACRVPAGGALAVDRDRFSAAVTQKLESHPLILIVRDEVTAIPEGPAVVASGPLTSDVLAGAIAHLVGGEHLYFYDAVAPIVDARTIDMSLAFRASRYGQGGADYLNCPMSRSEYLAFVEALVTAERAHLRDFESRDERFFEACLPVEVLASRGPAALSFGPLRPVGLIDPRTGARPYAVVQLRQDDLLATAYNLVGFQTNLRYSEQRRVFGMIPGLENVEFIRYGQMHRNTFLKSPSLLQSDCAYREREDLFFAGQLIGTEGYVGSIGSGWVSGVGLARRLLGQSALVLPDETMLGALCHYVSHADPSTFQPMKPNFGLLPPLRSAPRGRQARRAALVSRSMRVLRESALGVSSHSE